jgi:rsbT co-antagonist protein RsbR
MKDKKKSKEQLLKEIEKLHKDKDLLENLLKSIPISLYFKDTEGHLIRVSRYYLEQSGAPSLDAEKELIGKTDFDLFGEELAKTARADEERIMKTREPIINRAEVSSTPEGETVYLSSTKAPMIDKKGNVIGIVGMTQDITSRKVAEIQLKALLGELSTPVLYAWEGIIIMPLIGTLTSDRAQKATHTILKSINRYNVRYAIIDITGVSVMDSMVADQLIKTARAVKTLGSKAIITGVSSDIASTIVDLGINMQDVTTKNTLLEGLHLAIKSVEEKDPEVSSKE